MILILPMKLPSVANQRMHWAAKAKQVKAQRNAVKLAMRDFKVRPQLDALHAHLARGFRVECELTRIAPRPIQDEHDNLRSAWKAVVDQVAAELGVNDGSGSVSWMYSQIRGRPRETLVEIRISPLEPNSLAAAAELANRLRLAKPGENKRKSHEERRGLQQQLSAARKELNVIRARGGR